MEQLGGLDTTFLSCETPTMHLQICALVVLDTSTSPDGYSFERLRSALSERLPSIPAIRRRLVAAPFHIGRPFWVDDPYLDVDDHLHRVVLAPHENERDLARIAGEIAGRPLRRDRPLWEIWVVEGLPAGRVALVVKMHHATIDGVSGASALASVFDLEPRGERIEPLKGASVSPLPMQIELFARAVTSRLAEPIELIRLIPETAARFSSTLWRFGHRSRTDRAMAMRAIPFTAPRTVFNAALTSRRSVAFVDVSLDEVKRVKNAAAVTVNDVVTALVGSAVQRYLERHGHAPDHSLIAAMPVAVHEETKERSGTNKLSVMFSILTTGDKEPLERLRSVASANAQAKEIQTTLGADTLMRWAEHFWYGVFSLGARAYSALHLADHHPVIHNLILSNVPGPPVALYLAGARLVGFYPLGPLTDGAGLNVTALSQEDRIGFGFIACPDLVPDLWELAHAVPDALKELVAASESV